MTDETRGTAEYVVQRYIELHGPVDEPNGAWEDIATVTVPAKSKRKTIIGLALEEAGIRPEVGGEPLRLRALDVRSAHVTTVVAKVVEPTLEMS